MEYSIRKVCSDERLLNIAEHFIPWKIILHLIQVPLKNVFDVFVPSGKVRSLFEPLNFGRCFRQIQDPLNYFIDAMPLIGNMKTGDHP
jgi:hypothetical protein